MNPVLRLLMILSDNDIYDRCLEHNLVEPFKPNLIQPASIDVRLGNHFKIFQRDKTNVIDFRNPVDITKDVWVKDDEYFLLHPGEFALGVTYERLNIPSDLVGRLEGKSSIGRLGLFIHVTAGFIDPGFKGPVTLEMYGLHPLPLMLWPRMEIAQISFQQMVRPAAKPYNGRYQNAKGVESSKYGRDITDVLRDNRAREVFGMPTVEGG